MEVRGEARLGFETSSSKCGYREAGCAGPEGTGKVLERQLDVGSGGDEVEVEGGKVEETGGAGRRRNRSRPRRIIYGAILIWVLISDLSWTSIRDFGMTVDNLKYWLVGWT